ncbi:MAG: hypothetical protein ACRD2C_14825 [Acidimicrobiales bacterium]
MGVSLDVRRLAAVDLHGLKGRRLRARIILGEFLLAAVLGPALGLLVLVTGGSVVAVLFGLWLIGAGLNYVPLAIHAWQLSRPGALDDELEGVDIPTELRYYTVAQLWVFMPLSLVVFAARQLRTREAG